MNGFCALASGSKGNCIYIGTKHAKLLIDAGISSKWVIKRLGQLGVNLSEIDAILVTHEHADHIKGLGQLGCKMGIPVFANSDTAKAIYGILLECPKFKIFTTGETFEFGDIQIHPFSVQHDAIDPVAFIMRIGALKIGFCTDLGFPTTPVIHQLRDCDYLYLESNHQPSMVHACNRPMTYKHRVLGRQGHLSNEQCAELLLQVAHPNLKRVYLAHLSSECNSPELALEISQKALQQKSLAVELAIAHQDRLSDPVFF